jgi:tetratricopeptide (TPR) repeat protein
MDLRVNWLVAEYSPWLNAKTLLEARGLEGFGRDRTAMFYSQSWLLVHYLVIENGDFPTRNADFLKRRERGEPVTEAFEAAFGIEVNLLNKVLQRYLRKGRYFKGKLRQPLPPVEATTQPLPKHAVAAALGWLALQANDADAARPFFEAALAADPDSGSALSGLGDVHKLGDRFDEARSLYERAIAREPGNENHEIDYAEFFLHRARKEKEGGASAARVTELLVDARRHFMRAYKLNPDNPETLAMNGATYLVDGVDAALGVESLEVAHQLLPSQGDIRLLLAKAYIAAGEHEKARRQLEVLLAWAHSGSIGEIQDLLASVDEARRSETARSGNLPTK